MEKKKVTEIRMVFHNGLTRAKDAMSKAKNINDEAIQQAGFNIIAKSIDAIKMILVDEQIPSAEFMIDFHEQVDNLEKIVAE